MQMKSKKYYEGNWSGNYPNGFGIAAAKDVENVLVLEYRGNWEDGFYNGYGERHYPDHSYYKGYFRCNKRHGYGQYWMADGAFYDGDWANDVKHGLGMYVYPDGNRYEGGWKNDLKHGRGRYFHLHVGEMQEGVWVKDICVTSHLVYIPYYEICCCPGEYLMQLLELKDPDMVCKMAEDRALGEDSEDNLQESLDSSEKSLNTL
ncbi:PREDICTED: MORN repeat-containing protein 3-like [Nicrophorus vespilloides]|uniref:MORN repeat-containing protein 3 n=1 Tax=Nicrophorus vespilloides TaxID=110193 RepID=A0ABM1MUS5_NICVS|nr:PREDICTED: MORN repeat-containing protein 3-like [Nicrophorus vespilloides]